MSLRHDFPHDDVPHGYHDDRVDAFMFAMQASPPSKQPWYRRLWNWLKGLL